jgi:hypothetical protein
MLQSPKAESVAESSGQEGLSIPQTPDGVSTNGDTARVSDNLKKEAPSKVQPNEVTEQLRDVSPVHPYSPCIAEPSV